MSLSGFYCYHIVTVEATLGHEGNLSFGVFDRTFNEKNYDNYLKFLKIKLLFNSKYPIFKILIYLDQYV